MSEKRSIKKLTIKNFRNIPLEIWEFNEGKNIFKGKNGIGKTSKLEAISWVLSGELFNGVKSESDMNIIPNNAPNNVEVSVEIEFNTGESIKKTYERKFVIDKNTGEEVQGVNSTYFHINGVLEKKNSDAIYKIDNILGTLEMKERIKLVSKDINANALLINPESIKSINSKNFRNLIMNIVGEKSPLDLLSDENELDKEIKNELQFISIDDLITKLRNQIKGTTRQKGKEEEKRDKETLIESLYQKKQEMVVDNNKINLAKENIKKADDKIIELKVRLSSGIDDRKKTIDLEIAELENKKQKIRIDIENKNNELKNNVKESPIKKTIDLKNSERETLKNEYRVLESDIKLETNILSQKENTILQKEKEINLLKENQDNLREEYKKLTNKSQDIESGNEITCPCCNQKFILENAIEYKEIRERGTKEKINEILAKGKEIKNEIPQKELELEELKKEKETQEQKVLKLQKQLSDLTARGVNLKQEIEELEKELENDKASEITILNYLEDKDYLDIEEKIKTLKTSKETLLNDHLKYNAEIQEKIKALETYKETFEKEIAVEQIIKKYESDIQNEEKELQIIKDELAYLILKETRVKNIRTQIIEETDAKAKEVFGENIKFNLFEISVTNGNLVPICDMLVKDTNNNFVPIINGINTGNYYARIIEFIEKLQEFYNVKKIPILIDGLESLSSETLRNLNTNCQIIGTQVTNDDLIVLD